MKKLELRVRCRVLVAVSSSLCQAMKWKGYNLWLKNKEELWVRDCINFERLNFATIWLTIQFSLLFRKPGILK
ncbi:hypothetical protein DsansV1_C19g0158771 [Dioscorea sansibarensis]